MNENVLIVCFDVIPLYLSLKSTQNETKNPQKEPILLTCRFYLTFSNQ